MSAETITRPAPATMPWLERLGPAWCLAAAITSLGVIPVGSTYVVGDRVASLVVADVDGSALVPATLVCLSSLGFAAMALAVRDAVARRACLDAGAQTLSYGVAFALAMLPLALVLGSLDLVEMVGRQDATFTLDAVWAGVAGVSADEGPTGPSLPRWGIVIHPLAVLLVAVCGLGALRLPPFDSVAATSEAATALQTEGSGLRLGSAVLADAAGTLALAALVVTVGLGGWSIPWLSGSTLIATLGDALGAGLGTLVAAGTHAASFAAKLALVFTGLRQLGRRLEPMSAARARFLCSRLFIPLVLVHVFATGYWLVGMPGPS